jgi:hypothetical protein
VHTHFRMAISVMNTNSSLVCVNLIDPSSTHLVSVEMYLKFYAEYQCSIVHHVHFSFHQPLIHVHISLSILS